MRITGGMWRGRTLRAPKAEATRPTQDRVREALFNLLQPVIVGARFLDLYAGSGAVGLEALSRGAARADFIERDRRVFETLRANLAAFGVEAACARLVDADAWLAGKAPPEGPWDVVFADPPYRHAEALGAAAIGAALLARGALAAGGILALETDLRTEAGAIEGFGLLRDRVYGKTRLALYRRADGA